MFGKVYSASVLGIDGFVVEVEADTSFGLPSFEMVGLLGSEVKEASERVRTALKNSGFNLPSVKLVVNLSPADIKKVGNYFDLPIALAILISIKQLSQEYLANTLIVGELSLDGSIKPINGTLSIVATAKENGFTRCIVPLKNLNEGSVVEGIDVFGVSSLTQTIDILNGKKIDSSCSKINPRLLLEKNSNIYDVDFSDINGQIAVKRAVEVAVSGMHNILIVGSPGSGKSMIANRIPTILPSLTLDECIEITKIYSIAGLLSLDESLILKRPFCAPHHTISIPAFTGGGNIPKPGEISLANRGVLFLDELPEFPKSTLEILRQPLEDKKITISRMHASITFPANFSLVAAMNPCKCGYYPDRNLCHCRENDVKRYINRISQPLLDRFDVCIESPKLKYDDLTTASQNESSKSIRTRVESAMEIQKTRYKSEKFLFNSELSTQNIKKYCYLGKTETDLLKESYEKLQLSARAYHKILKVARTIADLEESDTINVQHISEAICYRTIDKKFWGK